MTLQNLNKILDKYEAQLGSTTANQFELLNGLPFYNWTDPTTTAAQMMPRHSIMR